VNIASYSNPLLPAATITNFRMGSTDKGS